MSPSGEDAPSAEQTGRKVAELLLRSGAIHISRSEPYFLAAGWASPVYVDVRRLIGEADLRKDVIAAAESFIAARFAGRPFDALAGAETAGIPFASWLADRLGLKLRYVRKRPLGIGRNAQVEGGPVDGLTVLLVDDLTTDGGSKLAFARGLRAAGATVAHVLTIFYHDAFPGADARLEKAGLELHALATWADILHAPAESGLSRGERETIEAFLADPVAWSTRHGGRSTPP